MGQENCCEARQEYGDEEDEIPTIGGMGRPRQRSKEGRGNTIGNYVKNKPLRQTHINMLDETIRVRQAHDQLDLFFGTTEESSAITLKNVG